MNNKDRTILGINEHHPIADDALHWLCTNFNRKELFMYKESFASCAIENNRLAEVCLGTLSRLMNNEPVGDRYLLGLAWLLRNFYDEKNKKEEFED